MNYSKPNMLTLRQMNNLRLKWKEESGSLKKERDSLLKQKN